MTDDEKQKRLANALGQAMRHRKPSILAGMKAIVHRAWDGADEQAEQYLQGFIDGLMETRTETGDKHE